jgi:hypothetical protein
MPDILLAHRLAQSVGYEEWALTRMKEMYEFGLQLIASVVCKAAPTFTDDQAREIGQVLMSMLSGSSITDLDRSPEKLREQAVGVLRRYLTPEGVAPAAFDASLASC